MIETSAQLLMAIRQQLTANENPTTQTNPTNLPNSENPENPGPDNVSVQLNTIRLKIIDDISHLILELKEEHPQLAQYLSKARDNFSANQENIPIKDVMKLLAEIQQILKKPEAVETLKNLVDEVVKILQPKQSPEAPPEFKLVLALSRNDFVTADIAAKNIVQQTQLPQLPQQIQIPQTTAATATTATTVATAATVATATTATTVQTFQTILNTLQELKEFGIPREFKNAPLKELEAVALQKTGIEIDKDFPNIRNLQNFFNEKPTYATISLLPANQTVHFEKTMNVVEIPLPKDFPVQKIFSNIPQTITIQPTQPTPVQNTTPAPVQISIPVPNQVSTPAPAPTPIPIQVPVPAMAMAPAPASIPIPVQMPPVIIPQQQAPAPQAPLPPPPPPPPTTIPVHISTPVPTPAPTPIPQQSIPVPPPPTTIPVHISAPVPQPQPQTTIPAPPPPPKIEMAFSLYQISTPKNDAPQQNAPPPAPKFILQPWPVSMVIPKEERNFWLKTELPLTPQILNIRDTILSFGKLPENPEIVKSFANNLHELSLQTEQGVSVSKEQANLLWRVTVLDPKPLTFYPQILKYQPTGNYEGELFKNLPEPVKKQLLHELPEGKTWQPETLQKAVEKILEMHTNKPNEEIKQVLQHFKEQIQWTRIDQDTRVQNDRENVFYFMHEGNLQKGRLKVKDERKEGSKKQQGNSISFAIETKTKNLGDVHADLTLSKRILNIRLQDSVGTAGEAVQAERESLAKELADIGITLGELLYGKTPKIRNLPINKTEEKKNGGLDVRA